jgi:type IV fimbrial biogenesis protein FimT
VTQARQTLPQSSELCDSTHAGVGTLARILSYMSLGFLTGRQAPDRRSGAGFTLVELLVTVAVLSVLLSLAVPAFRTYLQNDTQWLQQNTLLMTLNSARSEAIKQDVAAGVQVCASADGLTCTGANWAQGWIVLSSASATPIQVVGALPVGTTLSEANGNLSLTFLSNGGLNTAALANPGAAVAFTMCDSRGAPQARYTQVSLMGRVASGSTAGQTLTGAALACP